MDLSKMFKLQRVLDNRIQTQHNLDQEDLVERKILALLVELGELANETRCFKFWSLKEAAPRETILEEFVDGVHFILSLGIELGFEENCKYDSNKTNASLTEQFLKMYNLITTFKTQKSLHVYEQLLTEYFALGELLSFTSEEISRAYIQKNEVNHERQQKGY